MRNKSKITTLESKFPLLSIEQGCMVSKDADITVAFRVELPELFTVTSTEYEAMHSAWHKAIKVLPDYSIVHKQDWFIKEDYQGKLSDGGLSFLARSSERHFNERPYLHHSVYLFLTKTNKQRMAQQSNFSSLCRGHLLPKEITNKDEVMKFMEAVDQFERIINDTEQLRIVRMTEDELVGTNEKGGLLDRYFSLSEEGHASLEDIRLGADLVRVGDNQLCLHTLSDTDDLPTTVSTDSRYERLSTDRSDCRLSFASPVGLMLPCNHIYNQYLFIEDSDANLERFEKQARNMHSLARYSRSNQINEEWIQEYLNIAHSQGLTSIRAHFNVLAWSSDKEELRQIKNDVGSALALMECHPRHNTIDAATLYWAGIPGNAADFPAEESFYTFIEPALCFFTAETNYKDSLSPFGIKMADRLSGKPIHLDISDLPMKKGVITNRNKFILGPSGSGKSFFTNHMVRQYYEQGAHVLLVDTGNSYQGLCELIHRKTKGEDGVYFTYTNESPISFNPFYTDDYFFDVEKRESICTLLLTLWKSADEHITKTEAGELGSAVNSYIELICADHSVTPCFNTFYEYLRDVYRKDMEKRDIKVTLSDFNINNLLTTLKQYYKGGRYDFLLNSDKNIDLLSKRFIVFEIDQVKDNKDLFPVVTIIIMEAFINKMRRLKGIRKMTLMLVSVSKSFTEARIVGAAILVSEWKPMLRAFVPYSLMKSASLIGCPSEDTTCLRSAKISIAGKSAEPPLILLPILWFAFRQDFHCRQVGRTSAYITAHTLTFVRCRLPFTLGKVITQRWWNGRSLGKIPRCHLIALFHQGKLPFLFIVLPAVFGREFFFKVIYLRAQGFTLLLV